MVEVWIDQPGPWVIEGVVVMRSLKYWLHFNPNAKPCDLLYWFDVPRIEHTRGQANMLVQAKKLYAIIGPKLVERGVMIVEQAKQRYFP